MTTAISIVVSTRNRADILARCLDALFACKTPHAWELIVVDNGSTDRTLDYLRSIEATSVPVGIIREEKRGASNARNAGWRVAKADVIAFVDDDCYVAPDYIDQMLAVFNDATIGFAGGRVLLYDRADLPLTLQESNELVRFAPNTFVAAGNILSANMACRRSTSERIGGFDPMMGPGTRHCCEDVTAVAMAVWSGIEGVYSPGPTVYHHHGRKTQAEKRKLLAYYLRGTGAYYAKFILRPDSRRTYLRVIRIKVREAFAENGFFGSARDLIWQVIGAARYCLPLLP
jgi:glycosyltransferase involved in cell wall biosynthesis